MNVKTIRNTLLHRQSINGVFKDVRIFSNTPSHNNLTAERIERLSSTINNLPAAFAIFTTYIPIHQQIVDEFYNLPSQKYIKNAVCPNLLHRLSNN